jgi:hypothetical protein
MSPWLVGVQQPANRTVPEPPGTPFTGVKRIVGIPGDPNPRRAARGSHARPPGRPESLSILSLLQDRLFPFRAARGPPLRRAPSPRVRKVAPPASAAPWDAGKTLQCLSWQAPGSREAAVTRVTDGPPHRDGILHLFSPRSLNAELLRRHVVRGDCAREFAKVVSCLANPLSRAHRRSTRASTERDDGPSTAGTNLLGGFEDCSSSGSKFEAGESAPDPAHAGPI